MVSEAVEKEFEEFEISSIRHAELCAIVVNMHRDPKYDAAKIEDFLPGVIIKKLHPVQTDQQKIQAAREKAQHLAARCRLAEKRNKT